MTVDAPRTAIVIGNGVVGLNVALALQRRGTQVTMVAPDAPWRGASWGNAGHIAVEQVAPLASLATVASILGRLFSRGGAVALPLGAIAAWLPFSLRLLGAARPTRFRRGKAALAAMLATAIPAWQRVLEDAGSPGLLRIDGHFVVWETPKTAALGRAVWMAADIGTATVRDATPDELAQLATLTDRPIAGAIRFLGSGQITDTGALGEALVARFVAAGGKVVHDLARSIVTREGHAHVTLTQGGPLDADVAVIAAGAASGALAASAGMTAPLIAERGYHIEGDPGDWPADQPPVVFEDRSMIVTRFADRLRAASIVEFARTDTPPDPRKWDRLSSHVAALGLPLHDPIEKWMGARPTLPDYLPAIGRRGPVAYAFGHQHLGLTLAATTGEALAAELYGEAPAFDLSPFDLARFG
ncbi:MULTISPECIES: NAD(P)/FAD-dependent oxidoreductase [unclassified Sphingomonas]|uniref:NAD(P)/FAD-dependent oxidoreductase n=1 Tax=unclassified Sphingomonas TaxID=196159 RepID=UPI0007022081|nr:MULTISPECIES: FAD-binding oxidoreductase [unclassified Sphingomonas]KQM66260.1 FAD-dependent oxidoreductase [Sphingomonas sp. Leaf16]KQN08716.1 FAD-dependent oxidoreductase [Sphingomonas sp. Leaf29]KQN17295.1 FAD-dependent oxidoreductase [Sphingomonas sp. Leaf32]